MKVAVLTNFIAPYRATLLQELQKQFSRMQVFVSTPMEPNRRWPVQWGNLDVVVQKNLTFKRGWKHPKGFEDTLYIQFPYNTVPLLTRYKPDVIVSVEFGMRTLQAALFCMLFPNTRLIVWAQISESTEQARGRLRHFLRQFLSNRMDAVFVNGQSGKRYLQNNFSVPDDKIFFSPNTTDVARFAEIPVTREDRRARRMLYVGQFIERKGIAPFLTVLNRWCAEHPDGQYELWMAGSGPLRKQIRQTPWPENLKVRFLGDVAYEDLPKLYAKVGLMVFPTLADEWGVVTVEAMAAGVPVLGSIYAQSVEEMIKPGINGWSFEPDSTAQTLAVLEQALSADTEQLNRMRVAARKTALSLTPERVTEMMVQAIKTVG